MTTPSDTITFPRSTWDAFSYWVERDASNENITDALRQAWDELEAVAPPAQAQLSDSDKPTGEQL